MAKKKIKNDVSPLMGLSMLAFFLLVIPFLTFSKSAAVKKTNAAQKYVRNYSTPSPVPEAVDKMMR